MDKFEIILRWNDIWLNSDYAGKILPNLMPKLKCLLFSEVKTKSDNINKMKLRFQIWIKNLCTLFQFS